MEEEEEKIKSKRSFPKILLIGFLFIIFGSVMSWGITSDELDELCNVNDTMLFKNSSVGGSWSCATIPVGITEVYGEMFFHNDSGGSVVALTEDVWSNVSVFDEDESSQKLKGITYSSSVLKVVTPGEYDTHGDITFTGTPNNRYHAVLGINGVNQLNTESHDRISTGSDVMSMHSSGLLTLGIDDEITLLIMNENSGGDATALSSKVHSIRIGD